MNTAIFLGILGAIFFVLSIIAFKRKDFETGLVLLVFGAIIVYGSLSFAEIVPAPKFS